MNLPIEKSDAYLKLVGSILINKVCFPKGSSDKTGHCVTKLMDRPGICKMMRYNDCVNKEDYEGAIEQAGLIGEITKDNKLNCCGNIYNFDLFESDTEEDSFKPNFTASERKRLLYVLLQAYENAVLELEFDAMDDINELIKELFRDRII